jgi:hypothetical protein
MCKVGLNPQQLTKWGRKEATKHPERSYKLYRQSITHTGKITFYKQLKSYVTEVEHSLKVVKTAKSSMVKTAEDALRIADKFGLKAEVQRELDNGATPLEALKEWDII